MTQTKTYAVTVKLTYEKLETVYVGAKDADEAHDTAINTARFNASLKPMEIPYPSSVDVVAQAELKA
ncbi:hypothetical protein [Mesorhizobium sp. M8A.F.Ca.ET.165.01.1.1]|uniref:hypothetical protein n=1 Tax=Mesorhizobium sp. M8A.F.Ca.ET.165.01.1.1 TaxID=2563960 RepID=UPI001093A719|nr:hypothetical protein [Mesorhizobium sp. M8A.F.Ca.ET.165.01.1.1]TGT42757.1 hypothetical protein EN808_12810 [Mesorhizobium sp. M8A.F.Ca.ET.165.01.1.1]